jgi:hypothetical protein
MKTQTGLLTKNAEPSNPLLNAAILAAVALTVLPAAIFGAVRYVQSSTASSTEEVEVVAKTPKRISAAERRAQRLEARKAKATEVQNTYPEITMEKVDPYYDGFEMEYDADMEFNNGFGMMPPAYMGGPGMMPAPYMGGPGMMPAPYMGNFNGGGRMPGAGTGFNNGFGRGRGGF